jgi:hypothetical protein
VQVTSAMAVFVEISGLIVFNSVMLFDVMVVKGD